MTSNVNNRITRNIRKSGISDINDFSKVGGLSHHINTLRDLIIFPLLHGSVYSHFQIKAPRGVLFYGPPGTGKTLVAGALATELSKEGSGKVTFFQRKGADVLDKWVGESEKKLRDLFEKAAKSRPSVIFFDELDGLAPIRSHKNDHVHCSVVATLLALMDGLDSMPGVVVIGATNRLESVDPALRRPGRFDKELYFPLPATEARKEIIQVHTQSWKQKPSPKFIQCLAELTSGFCGSDIQALCSEAVLCSVKRLYPNIQHRILQNTKSHIDLDKIKIEEADFIAARHNLVSSSMKSGSNKRNLNPTIRPLLQRQLDKIVHHLQLVWPHYLQQSYKYLIGSDRYAGRVVIFGSNKQGLNTHLLPAILQTLEHIPSYVLDIPTILDNNLNSIKNNLPSVLVLSRVDEWWCNLDTSSQISISSTLENIHAGLPILILATCKEELPPLLHDLFYNNCSVIINIDNPTRKERGDFFAPIFFDDKHQSLTKTLINIRTSHMPMMDKTIKREGDPKPKVNKSYDKHGSKKGNKFARLRGGGYSYHDLFNIKQGRVMKPPKRTNLKDRQSCCNFQDDESYTGNVMKPPRRPTMKDRQSCCNLPEADSSRFSDYTGRFIKAPRTVKEGQSCYNLPEEEPSRISDYSEMLPSNTCLSCNECNLEKKKFLTTILSDLIGERVKLSSFYINNTLVPCDKTIKEEPDDCTINYTFDFGGRAVSNSDRAKIYNLWQRTLDSSENMPVSQLELLYDSILTCIHMYSFNFKTLYELLENILLKVENSEQNN